MNAGHDSGLPDYSGGYGPSGGQGGHLDDPYAVGPASTDPSANDPYATDPYSSSASGSYSSDPSAGDPLLHSASVPGAPQSQQQIQHPAALHPGGPIPQGPPQFGAFQAPLPSSGMAIAGFVLGLVGLVMCGGLTSPFGIYFSARGMKETEPTARELKSGRGLAIAGMVTSLVGLIPLLFMLLYAALMIVGIVMSVTA
ncbi:MAG: DUF4190 domain-containing protein [Brachybacterium sp.]|nr:DUF4190 domain-containing protein [Brachybacterium sp.]